MRLLLDTHILLWAASSPQKLTNEGRRLLADPDHELWFSVVSIWEIAVKRALGRKDFNFDPGITRRMVLEFGFRELTLTGEHALQVESLPLLHKDPFDRIMIAQALSEAMTFATSDKLLIGYPGWIRLV